MFYEDGRAAGRREPHGVAGEGDTLQYREQSTPGMIAVYEYRLTRQERREMGSDGRPRIVRVARFVRTLLDEPILEQSLRRIGARKPG